MRLGNDFATTLVLIVASPHWTFVYFGITVVSFRVLLMLFRFFNWACGMVLDMYRSYIGFESFVFVCRRKMPCVCVS